jgi:hypothetical protein
MCQCFDRTPDPNIEWLFSISINRLEELKRGLALGTVLRDQLRDIETLLMCFN